MKIAIFSDCYLDLTGGIVTAINADKAELERRGHEVHVFSSAFPRDKTALKKLARKHIHPVPSCKVFGRGLTPIARRPRIIEYWLLDTHPELQTFDVFYIHYEAGCSIAALRLGKRLGVPTVQVMHGREDVGEAALIPRGFRTLVALALNWFHSWYLAHPLKIPRDDYLARTSAAAKMWTLMVSHANFADLVLTPSKHFKKKLLYYGVSRDIVALPHGLPDRLCRSSRKVRKLKPGETLEIIWHSRVSKEKRLLPFLKALAEVTGPYHLTVFGDGNELSVARRFVSRHHLNVTFCGAADFRTIYRALLKSHLDVLVSYNYDTFGMTIIEAASAGVPVLLADPDLAEVAPAGGFLLSVSPDPAALAAALNSLFSDPAKISAMSEKMLEGRDELTISAKIDRLEKLFSDLVL